MGDNGRLVGKGRFRRERSSVREDFQWVYENLRLDEVQPEDAPSPGAWGLLEFAREQPRVFYTKWLEMASKVEDMQEVMKGFREDATRSVAEIAGMLDRLALSGGSEGTIREPPVQEIDPF